MEWWSGIGWHASERRTTARRIANALDRIVQSRSLPELWRCPPDVAADTHEVLGHIPRPTGRWRRAVSTVARRYGVTDAYVIDRAMTVRAVLSEVRQHDLYALLGVPPEVTIDELRRRWRELAKRYHPDRDEEGGLAFLRFRAAYAILSDPVQRVRYDAEWERTHGPRFVAIALRERTPKRPRLVPIAGSVVRGARWTSAAFRELRPPDAVGAVLRSAALAVLLLGLWLGAWPPLPRLEPEVGPSAEAVVADLGEPKAEVPAAIAAAPAAVEEAPVVAAADPPEFVGPQRPLVVANQPEAPALLAPVILVPAVKDHAVAKRGSKSRKPVRTARTETVALETQPRPAEEPPNPVTFSEARRLLDEFARRFATHQALGLVELFASDGTSNGRQGLAIAEDYKAIFRRLQGSHYTTSWLQVEPTREGANVHSEFVITADGRTNIRGHAFWVLVRVAGTVRVARATSSAADF